MTLNIALAVGVALALVLVTLVAAPARPRSVDRELKRRGRRLRHDPARALSADVALMLGHELPSDVSREVCRVAESREVPPGVLWSWAEAHSPTLLALAVGAGYDRGDLARTMTAECEIDQESLEMHAELNGSLVGSMVVHHLEARSDHGSADRAA